VIVVGLVIYAMLGLGSDLVVRFCERKTLAYRKVLGS
jgi:sulfonate transport system permease protein